MVLFFIGLAAAMGLAFWIGQNWLWRGGIFVVFASALITYSLIGRPVMEDQPLKARLDAFRAMDPREVSPEQWIALLTERSRLEPEEAMPHKLIGDMHMIRGRVDMALQSYSAALRRDNRFGPVMTPMADALMARDGPQMSEQAQQLYMRGFAFDRTDVKAGFMAGMRFWLNGERDQAKEWWTTAINATPEGSPERQALVEQVETLQAAMANVEAPDAENSEEQTDGTPGHSSEQ